jgi:hypothetical protein
MDYTILIVILIIAGLIGLTVLAVNLRKRNIVTADDLLFASNLLGLSISIINELNLQHEDKIKEISKVVTDAVNYVIGNMKNDGNEVELAYLYALTLCSDLKIDLTEERKAIIRQLIELSFNKINK